MRKQDPFSGVLRWCYVCVGELLTREQKVSSDLRQALAQVRVMEGLLPICASCKKIRDDKDQWQQLEVYIGGHSKAHFTHGLCPACAKRYLEDAGLGEESPEPAPGA